APGRDRKSRVDLHQSGLQGRRRLRGPDPHPGIQAGRHSGREARRLEEDMIGEWLNRYGLFVLLAGAVVAPLLAPNDYVVGVLARICLYSLLALGLNIVVGFAGLLDIGYVAFFGIGSYAYAFLASPHFGLHLPFVVIMPIIVAVTAIAGILIGAPTLRLRGDYLAIVTL